MDTTTIKAEDVMTRRLAVTTPQTHVIEATERLIAQGVSGLPVIDAAGKFVGRFSERTAITSLDLDTIQGDPAAGTALRTIRAVDLMDRWGLVLKSDEDVFHSINQLIARKVSGAPVVDADGTLRGVFSEQSAMHVFIGLCWEQLPSSCVTAWMDRHDERRIAEETNLEEILDRFQRHPYRRLMVMHGPKLVGQVTRRNALQAALQTSREPVLNSVGVKRDRKTEAKSDVASWMLKENEVAHQRADVLAVAQQFLRSAARQIPVCEDDRLMGQISRSDLLRAVQRFFPQITKVGAGAQPLYLSSVNKRDAHALL
ncbi:MAG: CBS domain-containing protein [Planctomycetaceae bacterium]